MTRLQRAGWAAQLTFGAVVTVVWLWGLVEAVMYVWEKVRGE